MTAVRILTATVGLCLLAGTASAASVSYESLASGVTSTATVGATTSYTQLPVSDTFGNSFACTSCASKVLVTDGASNYNFYDDYVFSVAASTIDAVSSTINLGSSLSLDNLQMRLYTLSGNTLLPVLTGTPSGLLSGSAASGGWSTPLDFSVGAQSGQVSVLNDIMLSSGTYVLEVRGDVTGTSGGSYSGNLNLTPVPLPAALPLLVGGLGLFAGAARKRAAR